MRCCRIAWTCSYLPYLWQHAAVEWLTGGRIALADVSTVVVHGFVKVANPTLAATLEVPHLTALSARCNEQPAFSETYPQA